MSSFGEKIYTLTDRQRKFLQSILDNEDTRFWQKYKGNIRLILHRSNYTVRQKRRLNDFIHDRQYHTKKPSKQ